ncbi:MAG TPA: DUF3455 domain-containing protein [Chitinophagales bacterium]|nr:DUF3455 domain-containing protein [Chitinophagales bacterium]
MSCQKSDLVPVITNDTDFLIEEKLQAPVVPDTIAVPDGNKVIWHTYASGVQIYEVTESTTNPGQFVWTFVAPSATLYKKPDFTKQVGTHYAGPTWEATVGPAKGKYVIGTKISSVTGDVSAIPWLLLKAVPSTDPEYYSTVTYIQRLYTTGGLAPATGATAENLGMQQSVPYTAAYYFYGAK